MTFTPHDKGMSPSFRHWQQLTDRYARQLDEAGQLVARIVEANTGKAEAVKVRQADAAGKSSYVRNGVAVPGDSSVVLVIK